MSVITDIVIKMNALIIKVTTEAKIYFPFLE